MPSGGGGGGRGGGGAAHGRPGAREIVPRLHHHELAGLGGRGDFGRFEREDVVIGREPPVGEHARVQINGHMTSIAIHWV
jgi:hypothetical protein